MKALSNITRNDLAESPIWEFVSDDDDLCVVPVTVLPVDDLGNRLVGTRVTLHNGEVCWAMLGNVSLSNSRSTEQFLTLSIEHDGKWFDLARYHDVDHADRGPTQLAQFLGHSVNEVFPISYDLSSVAVGAADVIVATILAEPRERLTESDLIELALE